MVNGEWWMVDGGWTNCTDEVGFEDIFINCYLLVQDVSKATLPLTRTAWFPDGWAKPDITSSRD